MLCPFPEVFPALFCFMFLEVFSNSCVPSVCLSAFSNKNFKASYNHNLLRTYPSWGRRHGGIFQDLYFSFNHTNPFRELYTSISDHFSGNEEVRIKYKKIKFAEKLLSGTVCKNVINKITSNRSRSSFLTDAAFGFIWCNYLHYDGSKVSLRFVADSGQSTGCSVMGKYHKLLWNATNSLWASPVSMYQGIHLEKKQHILGSSDLSEDLL